MSMCMRSFAFSLAMQICLNSLCPPPSPPSCSRLKNRLKTKETTKKTPINNSLIFRLLWRGQLEMGERWSRKKIAKKLFFFSSFQVKCLCALRCTRCAVCAIFFARLVNTRANGFDRAFTAQCTFLAQRKAIIQCATLENAVIATIMAE